MYRYLLVVLLIVFLFCQTDRKHIILSYGANFNIPSTDFASDETAFGKRIGFHYWLEKKLTVSIVYNIRSFKTDIDSTVQDFNFEHISLIPSYRLWESRSDFFMISLPLSLSISEEFTVSGKKSLLPTDLKQSIIQFISLTVFLQIIFGLIFPINILLVM